VGSHAVGQAQAAGQFHGDDLRRVMAHHDVDFMRARIQIIEQPLRVKRAAGSGDGNEDFQVSKSWRSEAIAASATKFTG